MSQQSTNQAFSNEIFSFHLCEMPILSIVKLLLFRSKEKNFIGLKHMEAFFIMGLGSSIFSKSRYQLGKIAFFAHWESQQALEEYLAASGLGMRFKEGWHVRMNLYRVWGEVSELKNAEVKSSYKKKGSRVVAVTLARLKLTETFRFISWGRPVESQVKHHKGNILAHAAMRPFNTFSTFSIWENEEEMLNMVKGRSAKVDGESHKRAMSERNRKPFHYEFSTMRFSPISEHGFWNGRGDYIFQGVTGVRQNAQ